MTDPTIQKIAALLAVALVLLLVNLKSFRQPMKALTFWGMNAALLGAAWFTALLVIA